MDKSGKAKILVIAHGHPDFSPGGGEIAAYSLFKGYKLHPAIDDALFLARVENDNCSGAITRHANNEYLWEQSIGDGFFMEGRNIWATFINFAQFLRFARPDIVHVHHAVHMGYEILEVIKKTLPDAKIYFTLHEYIPICHNNGQMITTDGKLCMKASLKGCHRCFPKKSEGDFWLRKRRFLHYFSHVDAFFAPSEFLRQRYIDWGIEPDQIHFQENGLREMAPCPPRPLKTGERRNRFGYFGQITPYKGLELLLQALELLEPAERANIKLEIHGAGFGEVGKKHENKLRIKYKKLANEGVVRWLGAYDPAQIVSRMGGVDWVVVPSIWWENSPVVIQEAFACGRPILASNMGGMAEKIMHHIDGILVTPRNSLAWANAINECIEDNGIWERLATKIRKQPTGDNVADAILTRKMSNYY